MYLCTVKKALFLLIAVVILFSQLNLPAIYLLEDEQSALSPADDNDDAVPLDPMEEYPEEGESEDSKETKDDYKKWQQHRFFAKELITETITAWNIHDAEQVMKPYVSKIQQPPEGSFSA